MRLFGTYIGLWEASFFLVVPWAIIMVFATSSIIRTALDLRRLSPWARRSSRARLCSVGDVKEGAAWIEGRAKPDRLERSPAGQLECVAWMLEVPRPGGGWRRGPAGAVPFTLDDGTGTAQVAADSNVSLFLRRKPSKPLWRRKGFPVPVQATLREAGLVASKEPGRVRESCIEPGQVCSALGDVVGFVAGGADERATYRKGQTVPVAGQGRDRLLVADMPHRLARKALRLEHFLCWAEVVLAGLALLVMIMSVGACMGGCITLRAQATGAFVGSFAAAALSFILVGAAATIRIFGRRTIPTRLPEVWAK